MTDIFISYARQDAAVAQRFADAFGEAGLDVWWDASLQAGELFDMRIEAAIKSAKAVVVIWSEQSVRSRWVRAEATLADRLKTLLPARIDACELPIIFELTHTIDLTDWDGSSANQRWASFLSEAREIIGRSAASRSPATDASATIPSTSSGPSVLVMPFVNMSGDPEQEYFADGVTEDIITDLGKVAALTVASRKTAFSHKGKTLSAADANAMGVSHMLEGSVRKSGNRVRITAQLYDAENDEEVWADRFDRTLEDIFAIQDEISEAIVSKLRLKLAPAERQAIEKRGTKNAEAYELFVMARQFSRSGSERMQPIIERICKKVVELDPDFADAWALMALTQAEQGQRAVGGKGSDGGRFAASRAVELDPNLAVAQAAMAEVFGRGSDMNFEAGEPYVRRALELDPECYEANIFAAYIYLGRRQFEKSVPYFEKAHELDSIAYRPTGMAIQAYHALGDKEATESAARRCLARCEKLLATEPDHAGALSFFVTALVELGEPERARLWTRRAVIFHPDNTRLKYNLACAMVEMSDFDEALPLLQDVVTEVSSGWLIWMDHDNSLDLIREDPRYISMMDAARKTKHDDAP